MNRKTIKIAFVSNTSWSLYNFRLDVINALIKKGHRVYTVAPRDDYSDKLTAAGARFINLKLDSFSTSPFRDLKTIIHLHRIYNRIGPDLIFHYTIKPNLYGGAIARLKKIKYFNVVTGLGNTFKMPTYYQSIINSFYKFSNQGAVEIWYLNKENKKRFIDEGISSPSNSFVLPSEGVNTRKFRNVEFKEFGKIRRFLFAGRLLNDKGIREYVEAAKMITSKFESAIFDVIGFTNPNNPKSITLQQLEKWQKQGYINYLGSHEDVRPFLENCDCLVFPSYYEEGVSRILLEAASMSRPIITTDHIGCRDVVTHNVNGILVPTKSTSALVDAIEYMMSLSPSQVEQMGLNGRQYVLAHYDIDDVIEIYFSKIDEVLNQPAKEHTYKNSLKVE